MKPTSGPTLGFESRAQFLAYFEQENGPNYFATHPPQKVCDWFICHGWGPQNLSPAFRRSIRALLAGERRPLRRGVFPHENRRRIFALPPSEFWPDAVSLPPEALALRCLHVTTASADDWRSGQWRRFASYLFYGTRPQLRAAYCAARLLLDRRDASRSLRCLPYFFLTTDHMARMGLSRAALQSLSHHG